MAITRIRVATVAEGTAGAVGEEFLRGLVRHVALAFDAKFAFVAEASDHRGDRPVDVLRLASEELGEAQVELRDLARGLHPVALSERGLRNALESLTVRSEIPMTVDVTGDELPDDVELAAYFVVSESLTNAHKYADASAVQVRIGPVADVLLVEVVDDGSGGADPAGGTGLLGLADRVDALGGRLEVDSPPGVGTRVSARLPLRERAPSPGGRPRSIT